MRSYAWDRPISHQTTKLLYRGTTTVATLVLLIFFLLNFTPSFRSIMSTRMRTLYKSRQDPLLQDVVNNTLGFQKIFCLGLTSRTDHRDAIVLSAAATELTVDWIDGVTDVEDKALPAGIGATLGKEGIGSWRGHMNALQTVVRENISSALILEDDADWDIRIKQQMHDFALSTRTLTQPLLSDPSLYADPTFPIVGDAEEVPPPMIFGDLPLTQIPRSNPYGDNWDVLWLGHCGVKRPGTGMEDKWKSTSRGLSLGHVILLDDETVPEPHYYHDFHGRLALNQTSGNAVQNHTRIVHHPQDGFCSVAYAVSQRGARKMLWYMGIRAFDGWFDSMLPKFCAGNNSEEMAKPVCITAQPQYFDQHVPRGEAWKASDIFPAGVGFRETATTPNIRWSTRINLPKLLTGSSNYTDQWPDTS